MNDSKSKKRKRPELLAPAGSIESFHAAIDSGADAIYLGLGDFNARLRAKNFTARDLCELVPCAHSRNVKIYVTVNTLIKQSEIKPVLNLLYQLEQIGVDAIIVADIGLMKLASTHFPALHIHGSTQAAVHNAHGAEFLKTLGVKRVVLARELSLDEITETTKKSPIETEVFIHGALCYSISGMCLASSFIGGASGNRGKCTQVCRRRFKCLRNDRNEPYHAVGATIGRPPYPNCDYDCADGYFFSPPDLQTIPAINKLIDAGVSCFKIEGRMKGAEYVSTVVKAYRRIIDSPGDDGINNAINDLRFDFGREKTMFFVDGCKGNPPIDPSRPSGTGVLIGTIIERNDTSFTASTRFLNNEMTIGKGDRLRVQPQNGFEGTACKVAECKNVNDKIEITVSTPIKCGINDHVFLIGKSEQQRKNVNTVLTPASTKNLKTNYPNAGRIANSLMPSEPSANINTKNPKPKLWFKVDKVEWLDMINATPCQHLIFDADVSELELLLDNPGTIRTWRSRMFVALPPFIEEGKVKFWRGTVEKCMAAGLESFAISNAGHFALVKSKGTKQLIADVPLWCLNRFTQEELRARGVNKFVFSSEDEYLNIRNSTVNTGTNEKGATGIAGIVQVYGRPPLFISRMPASIGHNIIVTDPHNNKFFVSTKNNLYYTLPQTPMCLFAKREKLSACGIENFLIDVCFHDPDYEFVNKLVQYFKDGIKADGSTIFNFKAGLH